MPEVATGLSPEVEARMREIFSHEAKFIANVFRIIDKKGQLTGFMPNQPQNLLRQRWKDHRFNFIIKGRKMGVSSWIFATDLYACATKQNQFAVCLAQNDEEASKLLNDKIKPLVKNAKIPIGAVMRGDKILFPATNSQYYVGTAGSKKFGRGSDITRFHLSEFAHWQDPEVLTAIEEACTDNAIGRIETTTNGFNHAQALWASSKLGKSRYNPIFIPWYADPTYRIPGGRVDAISEDEKRLMEEYGLDVEQLAWRRAKIRDMSRPELFPQEYPSNDIEAFISSGRPVFDWIAMQHQEQACEEPRLLGDLRDTGKRVEFMPSPNGQLKVWKLPDHGHVYVVGADIAEGLEDGAYSAAVVYDAGSDEQVAEWHGHIPPDLFGTVLLDLGHFYNNALLVPEAWPGPGEVTDSCLAAKSYRNLYRDPVSGRGWTTDRHSKQKACLDFAAAVRDLRVRLRSKELISEMRAFMYQASKTNTTTGPMGPAPGSFSDRVMAAAIGWEVNQNMAMDVTYQMPRFKDVFKSGAHIPSNVSVPAYHNVMGVRAT